jgi:hypothetical protein
MPVLAWIGKPACSCWTTWCITLQSKVESLKGRGSSSHVVLDSKYTQTPVSVATQAPGLSQHNVHLKLQTHEPNLSWALIEVGIKSSCAYTQELAQPFMLACEFCWRLPLWRSASRCQRSSAQQLSENEASTRELGAVSAKTLWPMR